VLPSAVGIVSPLEVFGRKSNEIKRKSIEDV